MVEITEQIEIERSADEVWSTLADFAGIARWAPPVDHSCLTTDQPVGVGAQRRVQVGRNALLERVVEWETGRKLSYEIDGLPPVVRSVTNSWELQTSQDATTVTVRSRIDTGPRPPQQLIARAVGRTLAKASRSMLTGLKAEVEAATTGVQG